MAGDGNRTADPADLAVRAGNSYPPPHDAASAGRRKRALGDAVGVTQFGVNLVEVPPGTDSSQRHWHSREDEFVYILDGELVLVTDAGEQVLGPGAVAGFPAGSGDGHKLVNRGEATAVYLEVGSRIAGDEVEYSDIDMAARIVDGHRRFVRKDGTPY